MVLATLSVQKTGMITLPKKWRDRNPGTTMIAKETPEGLLIKPLIDVEYWEDAKGNFGLHFPSGIDAREFLDMYKKASKRVDAMEAVESKKKKLKRSTKK
jgi:bifunctional DNA-binding transcriptional regulator/antitoxin component of YhaV-PrlF toxin-antitoxin module